MRRDMFRRFRWFAAAVFAVGLVGTAGTAWGALRVDLTEIRSYEIPPNFELKDRIVRSTPEGRTFIANTTGEGTESACTVVVASESFARAYPYRHSSRGSRCVGLAPHPNGGFFIRGIRAGSMEGEVAGFTARIGAGGSEKWLAQDVPIARSGEFRGSYAKPHPAMAYSAASGRLLEFSLGTLKVGELDERQVTLASVLEGGELQIEAKTLGSSGGFGVVGGVESLEQNGAFLVYMIRPGTQGAQFFTYDGRERVDAFAPLGEDWSERYVRHMTQGPDGDVYLLWTKEEEGRGPTHVTVVDAEANEVWSEQYAPGRSTGTPDSGLIALGPPRAMWVGAERVVVLYDEAGAYLRVIERQSGEEVGLAPLSGATRHQPLNIVRGPDGRLRLLAADTQGERFREMRMEFVETAGGDAGFADVDIGPDAGLDAAGGSGGGNGSGGGGCSLYRGAEPGAPAGPWFLVVLGVAALAARECRCAVANPARDG